MNILQFQHTDGTNFTIIKGEEISNNSIITFNNSEQPYLEDMVISFNLDEWNGNFTVLED